MDYLLIRYTGGGSGERRKEKGNEESCFYLKLGIAYFPSESLVKKEGKEKKKRFKEDRSVLICCLSNPLFST